MEIYDTLNKCSSLSTLGPDHISWSYLKKIVSNPKYITNIINIANTCINLSYWPLYFKKFTLVIILKPNKLVYDNLKAFQPIVLLNMFGKLIEKAIRNML